MAELTWDEAATDKPKETTQREKKVAVLRSRPMTCSTARLMIVEFANPVCLP